MATDIGSVTIDRAYFDTLLRMAQFEHGDRTAIPVAPVGPQDLTLVSKTDYDKLLLISRQYANLRANLMSGGVAEETITLLSEDDTSLRQQEIQKQSTKRPSSQQEYHGNGGPVHPAAAPRQLQPHLSYPSQAQGRFQNQRDDGGESFHSNGGWSYTGTGDDNYSTPYSPDLQTPEIAQDHQTGQEDQVQRPMFALACKRTIMLAGLPDHATHEDITKAVRGGMLLEVYIRAHERVANVSFLNQEDAARFYEHSRQADLYIRHRRVLVKWAERHFTLAGHVAGKIARGATRNLVIRRYDPRHTEDSIREDLEHIHNLVVIKVEFLGGSCYIKTNSVHNAMFARTCMMSRVKYKGSRIDWDVDECQQPLETLPKPSTLIPQCVPPKKPPVSLQNRFASLELDSDNDESESSHDASSELPAADPVHVGTVTCPTS